MVDDLIFDIGMNDGSDTAYYLHRGFRVVAVEANPALAEAGRRRFAEVIARGRLVIESVGVAETEAVRPFWICEAKPTWSSFDRASAARGGAHHAVEVRCVPVGALLARHGVPHYLKVDIEGHELLCLDGLSADDRPAYVSFEVGPEGVAGLGRMDAVGYRAFKCISQLAFVPIELPPAPLELRWRRWQALARSRRLTARVARRLGGRTLAARGVARLRRRGDWTFPPGSSGPFGEDTPGRWVTRAEVERAYARHAARHREATGFRNPLRPVWVDFHARLGPPVGREAGRA